MAGDTETGMMIMKMDEGLDTGPVALTRRIPIAADMTGGDLHDALSDAGAILMVEAMDGLEAGRLQLVPQPTEGATYARKIDKAELRVDWSRQATQVHDHVRALSPMPGAWCELDASGRAERLKLLRTEVVPGEGPPGSILDGRLAVACGSGAVRLLEVQRAGSRPMPADEFLRGVRLAPGDMLR